MAGRSASISVSELANHSEVAADVAVPTIAAHEQTRKTATEMSLKVRLLAENHNKT